MGGAGSGIQAIGNAIELVLGVDRQIGTLGQVLAQQHVGAFARAALSGAMRVTEISAYTGASLGSPCRLISLP
jgi:hypothetical protein